MRKLFSAILWFLCGIVVVVVLVAAINKSNDADCKGVNILINGSEEFHYLDRNQVISLMAGEGKIYLTGKPVVGINLNQLENRIRKNEWVSRADLYFDKDRVLQIHITEKTPIGRVFTSGGHSYFLDSNGSYLPLPPSKPAVRLPVFTGMPDMISIKSQADSIFIQGVKGITAILMQDSFWNAQVSQVAVTPDRQFELIPLIGDHIVLLGDGTELERKFRQLEIFYRNVLHKTGVNYYGLIDVRFNKQVVAVSRDSISTSVDKKRTIVEPRAAPLAVNRQDLNPVRSGSTLSHPLRKTDPERSSMKQPAAREPKAVMKKINN